MAQYNHPNATQHDETHPMHHAPLPRLHEEGGEGQLVLTMCLEALTILCNPEVALLPGAPLAQRLVDEVPTLAEGSALVAALLACLPNLGGELYGLLCVCACACVALCLRVACAHAVPCLWVH